MKSYQKELNRYYKLGWKTPDSGTIVSPTGAYYDRGDLLIGTCPFCYDAENMGCDGVHDKKLLDEKKEAAGLAIILLSIDAQNLLKCGIRF